MKVLQINTFYKYGSTGRIVYDLLGVQKKNELIPFVAYGPNTTANNSNDAASNIFGLQSLKRRKINILRTRLFDHHGFYNESETSKLIKWMDEIHPDIIHLHNIHNHYVNVKMLFDYIKQHDIPVVWTLHDCWSFTGHCAYFDYANCDKWKNGCHDCHSLKDYPPTWFFDRSQETYKDKKNTFQGVKNMVLCPPSKWLGDIIKQSFLKEYPVEVINNGIDISIFKPISSNVRIKYSLGIKKVLLAVVAGNSKRKGVDFLKQIPYKLTDNEMLVWVGIDDKTIGIKDSRFTAISHMDSREEMAALYSSADCFINTTLEDNFPTVNIEALACGTPVVTFNTGGSIESVLDNEEIIREDNISYTSVGAVVNNNIEDLIKAARKIILLGKAKYTQRCVSKAIQYYDKEKQYNKYIDLYNTLINNGALT